MAGDREPRRRFRYAVAVLPVLFGMIAWTLMAPAAESVRFIRRFVWPRLVNELLDVSRLTGGRLSLPAEEVELLGPVSETVERYDQLAKSAGCVVSLHADAEVVGCWDRLRLEQLVTNLLNNAIKYGPGRPVEVAVERKGAEALLTVTDHGIGIRPEDIGRIFGRFERAVSSRNYGGLGLGLFISRQIAEAHGGHIEVASEPGKRSRFTPKLPLQPADLREVRFDQRADDERGSDLTAE
jgi:signal transduction histidine kinase